MYPHQLFFPHPALRKERPVFLFEEPLFFGTDPKWPMVMHKQKLVLHFASMASYAVELQAVGYRVEWVRLGKGEVDGSSLLEKSLPADVSIIHVCDVVDDVAEKRLRRFCEGAGVVLEVHASPNFLTPADFLKQHTVASKKPFMARFYEAQRKRMDVLLDAKGGPEGGRWSFDEDNRRKWPKGAVPPEEPWAKHNTHVEDAIRRVEREFPGRPGEVAGFRWAVTREDARHWLDRFLADRFAGFGPYEDAIATGHVFLHHSAITPMLNVGLLDPAEVVERALKVGRRDGIPLASVEGFVRQVIGWREFICGVYRHRSVALRTRNFWGFGRRIPQSFYDGTTGIPPVDRVIRGLLKDGYCHHIERLMVLGCFLLLCRMDPDEVYRWFMEMFVDAYDWVMVPNVYGMSQFADGGSFTTKPYLCGSNYILKMSDEKRGDWCAVWDGLYWSFIADRAEFFQSNPRLAMMVRTWEKMSVEKKRNHREAAESFLQTL